MRTLYIVPCSAKKHRLLGSLLFPSLPAEEAYQGNCFRLARQRLNEKRKPWVVLSAKYMILFPWDRIEAYDEKMPERLTAHDVCGALDRLTEKQWRRLNRFQRIVCLGGAAYVNCARLLFYRHKVEAPLLGLGIGSIQQKLKYSEDWL